VRRAKIDSNDPANGPEYRGITSELYGGGPDLRIRQELLLGIGGRRLLQALGIHAEVCHLYKGYAAFAVLERAGSGRPSVRSRLGDHSGGKSLHNPHRGRGRL
jgi:glucan phosphorylase